MNVKECIKTLIGVDVSTDDIAKMKRCPAAYVSNKQDELKLKNLFELIDLARAWEVQDHEPAQ